MPFLFRNSAVTSAATPEITRHKTGPKRHDIVAF